VQLSPLTKRNRSNNKIFNFFFRNKHIYTRKKEKSLIQKHTINSTQKSWQIKRQTNWIIFTQKKKNLGY